MNEVKPELPAVRQPTDAGALMEIIKRAATDPAFDVAKLEHLLKVSAEWEAREARKAFSEAFANFKAEAVVVVKNKGVTDGPLKGKRYAELFSVVNAVTPLLSKYGLSTSWRVTRDEKDWIEVTCYLRHVLGHAEAVSFGGPPDAGGAKNAIQARASTVTYLERYTLKAVCGIAEQGDDSDGNAAGEKMSADVVGSLIKIIDGAENDKELLKAYTAAHGQAMDAGDMAALRLFTQHKDARKKALAK